MVQFSEVQKCKSPLESFHMVLTFTTFVFTALVEFACINFLDTFVKRKKQEIQKNQEKAEKDVKKVETVVNSIETNNVHEILKEKPVDNHDVAAIIKWNAIKGG